MYTGLYLYSLSNLSVWICDTCFGILAALPSCVCRFSSRLWLLQDITYRYQMAYVNHVRPAANVMKPLPQSVMVAMPVLVVRAIALNVLQVVYV